MTQYVVTDTWDKFGTYNDLDQAIRKAKEYEFAVIAVIKEDKLLGEYAPHPDGFFDGFYLDCRVRNRWKEFYHFSLMEE